MLVLGRTLNEQIIIGDDIVITVVRTGSKVLLGIDAPKDIPINRMEIYEAKKEKGEI